jgi:hypothetical protein
MARRGPVAKQADTESLENQAANALQLTLNEDDRFGVDAWSMNGEPIEIKSLNLESKSPAVQFAHNRFPEKYDSFLKQHCLVVLHRNSIAEQYWLLRRGENGFWTQWVNKCKTVHGREEEIVRRMQELYRENYEMDDFANRVVNRTIPGAVLTKKQWSFSISYLLKYGEQITRWPNKQFFERPPPKCDPRDHENMFKTD